ncbi:MAG: MalY/PatB family protein [Bacteroidaceae bacterium]
MKYNFDELIDRSGTDALKIEGLRSHWGDKELIPMWVADMDFRTPPFIMEAIRKRCEHEILGYTCKTPSYFSLISQWLKKKYQWKVSADMIQFTPGIVPGLAFVIQCFTRPGDKVIMQTPVYHPFFLVTQKNGRIPIYNPLVLQNGEYKMDIEQLRQIIDKDCKLFILCNPHNPGGRVWSKEELATIAEICNENHILVISDEIHADLTLPNFYHTPFATLSKEAALGSITFMAASKAFNMPGLSSSYAIIENPDIRERFVTFIENCELGNGHLFAFLSVAAAYEQGEDWLRQVTEYIQGNVDLLDNSLQIYTPKIKVIRPQASYLVFLDCRELCFSQQELIDFFVDDAHLALNEGAMFGKEGMGFMRMNIGCPRSVVQKAINNLKFAYEQRVSNK